jgi:hypothetical protein
MLGTPRLFWYGRTYDGLMSVHVLAVPPTYVLVSGFEYGGVQPGNGKLG